MCQGALGEKKSLMLCSVFLNQGIFLSAIWLSLCFLVAPTGLQHFELNGPWIPVELGWSKAFHHTTNYVYFNGGTSGSQLQRQSMYVICDSVILYQVLRSGLFVRSGSVRLLYVFHGMYSFPFSFWYYASGTWMEHYLYEIASCMSTTVGVGYSSCSNIVGFPHQWHFYHIGIHTCSFCFFFPLGVCLKLKTNQSVEMWSKATSSHSELLGSIILRQ